MKNMPSNSPPPIVFGLQNVPEIILGPTVTSYAASIVKTDSVILSMEGAMNVLMTDTVTIVTPSVLTVVLVRVIDPVENVTPVKVTCTGICVICSAKLIVMVSVLGPVGHVMDA